MENFIETCKSLVNMRIFPAIIIFFLFRERKEGRKKTRGKGRQRRNSFVDCLVSHATLRIIEWF
jgi:hypothetical protein